VIIFAETKIKTMKGINKLQSQIYQNKKGVWNWRVVAFLNLGQKYLSGGNQGYENKKECKEMATSWTYKGMTPEYVELKKYYRLTYNN
jgi:hypothetical protein